jgi:glycosyltransferase involved in cell wall biosynthesis
MPPDAQANGAGQISVVIPAYNRADLLRYTLRSVAEQDEPVAQVIVADDGSTDDTPALLEEFGALHVRNPDGGWGPSRARNAGLERVTTEYVAFLDSDDLWLPSSTRLLRRALEDNPAAPFAFGRGLSAFRSEEDGWRPDGLIGASRRELGNPRRSIFVRNSVPSPGALVRTEAARAVGGYDPSVVWSEDQHFWLALARHGTPVHVPELTSIYRRHAGNRYTPAIGQLDGDAVMALANGDAELEPSIAERLGVELCEVVMGALRSGRPDRAARATATILRRSPHRLVTLRRFVAHQRTRRTWWHAGNSLWEADPALRDWLARY